jgi:Uncharacterized protein conserved in bacteria
MSETRTDDLLLQHIRRFARYNRWANTRLYDACAKLSPEEYYAARPSFFGSIHATLNHILVADTIWFCRFTGKPTSHIKALNQILHEDFAGLRAARAAKARRSSPSATGSMLRRCNRPLPTPISAARLSAIPCCRP